MNPLRSHATVRPLAALIIASAMIQTSPARAGDAQDAPQGAGIGLSVRLVIDPVDPPSDHDPCGTASSLVAYTGERVRWCYRVSNNSGTSLTRHDLETTEFGDVLSNFPFTLVPGDSAYVTRNADVTTSLVEEAIWTAYNPGPVDQYVATGSARITVRPGTRLDVTFGTDPVGPEPADYCGTQRVANVPAGRTIRWCYRVTNDSSIPRTRHTLQTALAGTVLQDFPFTLQANADAFTTETQIMGSANLEETATWTAYRPGPGYLSTASGKARALAGAATFTDGFE